MRSTATIPIPSTPHMMASYGLAAHRTKGQVAVVQSDVDARVAKTIIRIGSPEDVRAVSRRPRRPVDCVLHHAAAGSYNTMLLEAAAKVMLEGIAFKIASIAAFRSMTATTRPSRAFPDLVRELQERLAAADGLFIATPEYNNSIPGDGFPVAVMGADAGTRRDDPGAGSVTLILRTLMARCIVRASNLYTRAAEVWTNRHPPVRG